MARHGFDYDLVIIGGGSTGIVAGNVAAALGARVALVEKERIGGECLWTGCVPSKALLHLSDIARTLRSAKALGLKNVRLTREDCAGVFAAVREKIERTRVNDASETMLRDFGVDLFFGEGAFLSDHLFRTSGGDLRAADFLIATGSSPTVPAIPGLSETGYLTNQTLFALNAVPESLLIVGGGYIACEMGQAIARLGAKVTTLERGERLLKRDDPELTEILTGVLRSENIEVLTETQLLRTENRGNGKKAAWVQREGRTITSGLVVAEILIATGRKGNTHGLNLTAVGVRTDEKGNISVDAMGRTANPHIWAGGDVTGSNQFSHMAEEEAKVLVRNILLPGTQKIPVELVPYAIFTDPELAHVGLTEAQAAQKYGSEKITVLRHEFRQDDRAIVENQETGLVKVIATGLNGTVVGASILGPRAGELIHEWVLAIRHKLPVRAIADTVHVYPTLNVSNQRAAQKWYAGIMAKPVVQKTLSSLFGFHPRDARNL